MNSAQVIQQVRENLAKLDACPRHDFTHDLADTRFKSTCRNCGGVMDLTMARAYERGLAHGQAKWLALIDAAPPVGKYILVRGREPWTYPHDSFTRAGVKYVDRFSSEPVVRELIEFGFTEWCEVPA